MGPKPTRITVIGAGIAGLTAAYTLQKRGVTVEVSPPVAASGAKLDAGVAVVGYVPIDHPTSYYTDVGPTWRRKFPRTAGTSDGWAGMWPDPLLPRSAFDLAPATTQPVWITVSAPESAAAGEYRGSVNLRAGGGILKEVPFTVTVRGFALPAESHVAAIYDLRLGPAWSRAGGFAHWRSVSR